MAKAVLVFATAVAYTPFAAPAFAAASSGQRASAPTRQASAMDDSDDPGGGSDGDGDDGDAPAPCLPSNAPSAVTGRCVPDFPEHECPDDGMSIWNRCPQSDPCAGGGASVNGECPGPAQRFCGEGVSFEGSCPEDSESARPHPFASPRPPMSPPSLVFG